MTLIDLVKHREHAMTSLVVFFSHRVRQRALTGHNQTFSSSNQVS
jgi:hypothetical protein